MFRNLRIRYKVLAGNVLSVVVVAAVVAFVLPARQRSRSVELWREEAVGLAESVALGVGIGVGLDELDAVTSALTWARREAEVEFITVSDPGGVELASVNPTGRAWDLIPEPATTQPEVVERPDLIEVAVPVEYEGQRLGTLWLGLSLDALRAGTAADRELGLMLSVLVLVLGSAVSLVMSSYIVRPIEELKGAADRIAQGDYDAVANVTTDDEIGSLASAFHTMVGKLKASLAELSVQAEELSLARDAALDATRAKSDFLATMSHEIRTPMNGVLGMLQLLEHQPLDAKSREYVTVAHDSADTLLAIINDILDFSKIEAGQLEVEHIEMDVRRMTEDVCSLMSGRAESRNVELVCAVDPTTPRIVVGDPTRLKQVLLNLVGNAIKFTENGEVSVRVGPSGEREAATLLRFEVRDDGIGIAEDAQRRLFQAFSQADSSTTRQFGGTGLGLAISKRLVELMGGQIGVESTPGKGSTFWFTARLGRSATQPRSEPVDHLDGCLVLVVDDNQTNRTMLEEMLTAWGARTLVAEDGPRALEVLRRAIERDQPPSVALLDMQMPGMDGLALGRVMKNSPVLSAIPCILLTSITGVGTAAEQVGITETLAKPVRRESLFRALKSALGSAMPDPRDEAPSARHRLEQTHEPLQLLLAEDNKINQQVAVALLGALGHSVEVAENGREAVEAALAGEFDAILMDCQMPEMDGFEATTEIRRLESKRHLIIAMTASAMDGDRERCIAVGMDDYITKPFKAHAAQAVLERLTSAERG